MEQNQILLLSQLIAILNENMSLLRSSYDSQDKEKFDSAKSAIIDAQAKINFLLKAVK